MKLKIVLIFCFITLFSVGLLDFLKQEDKISLTAIPHLMETPRSDSYPHKEILEGKYWVPLDFAKELEIENNTLKMQRDELDAAVVWCYERIDELEKQ